ncbi:MAG: cytochrome C oxidase subunit II [Deltaproteobacteria bacterium]|nr:cytochrome C oxidase subunit II [Deltaproteobacteria bacterium]
MRRLCGAAAAVAVSLGVSAWAEPRPEIELGVGLPRDVSKHGWRIDWLINTTNVFVIGLFATMVVWMLWACFRHGKKHVARPDAGGDRKSIMVTLGIAAAIFFVVDGNLFLNSTLDLERIFWAFGEVDSNPRTVKVEVNAHQWAWDLRYAGEDGTFGTRDDIVAQNDLRVPVHTPVSLQLGSTDVIHAFYLPNLRIKQDVVPGTINRMWFEARRTGTYDIGCAQHCGVGHYKMRGRLTVLSKRAFAQWAREGSVLASRAWDEADTEAHWGWAWKPAK